jgi:hypothetical protein
MRPELPIHLPPFERVLLTAREAAAHSGMSISHTGGTGNGRSWQAITQSSAAISG